MLITIDTENITEGDRRILSTVFGAANQDTEITALTKEDKPAPTRSRRTKLEIAFDDALAAYEGPNTGDGSEWAAVEAARDALQAKDPGNERLVKLAGTEAPVDPEAQEAAEEDETTDAVEEAKPEPGVTVAELRDLAVELIGKDRAAMLHLLELRGVRKVTEVDPSDYDGLAADIRYALA